MYTLGIHNTLDEISEVKSIAKRLSMTKQGRRIVKKLGIRYHEQQGAKTHVPDEIRSTICVDAVPRNVHSEYNYGRRKERAKTLADLHAGDAGARYVNADEYVTEED